MSSVKVFRSLTQGQGFDLSVSYTCQDPLYIGSQDITKSKDKHPVTINTMSE